MCLSLCVYTSVCMSVCLYVQVIILDFCSLTSRMMLVDSTTIYSKTKWYTYYQNRAHYYAGNRAELLQGPGIHGFCTWNENTVQLRLTMFLLVLYFLYGCLLLPGRQASFPLRLGFSGARLCCEQPGSQRGKWEEITCSTPLRKEWATLHGMFQHLPT